MKRVSCVITISEFCRQEILRHTGCAPDKVVVVPVPISDRYHPVPRAFQREKPTLLQVGQAQNKNLSRIIEAIAGLNVRLVTVGQLSAEHVEALSRHGIDYVNHRRLTDDGMVQAYVDADVLIFPSTYEGFGIPIIEAQAIGRPVITSTVASMPWVAGDAACLVDPYSVDSIRAGIIRVLTDDAYREELVANGFDNVKRFPAERIARLYLDEIQRVHASGSRGRFPSQI